MAEKKRLDPEFARFVARMEKHLTIAWHLEDTEDDVSLTTDHDPAETLDPEEVLEELEEEE